MQTEESTSSPTAEKVEKLKTLRENSLYWFLGHKPKNRTEYTLNLIIQACFYSTILLLGGAFYVYFEGERAARARAELYSRVRTQVDANADGVVDNTEWARACDAMDVSLDTFIGGRLSKENLETYLARSR